MPRYIIERTVGMISQSDMEAAAKRSLAVASEMQGVLWRRSYVSEGEGKIYCEYEAPDPQAIEEHSRRANLPVDRISLVTLEVNPSMFQ